MQQFEVQVRQNGAYIGTSHRRTMKQAMATADSIRERRPDARITVVTTDAISGATIASREIR